MATNTLNLYDPLFYAQEALIALENALGMANAVHRGYDATPQQKGSTIQISKPGIFAADNAPSSAQNVEPTNVSITLNQWKEVKFSLTDKELTFTKEKIITDHIRPAAYALANAIDQALNTLYATVPWATTLSSTVAPADLLDARKVLFDNGVPMNDGLLFAELSGAAEADLLGNSAFAQWQGSGQAGVDTQISGVLGRRYGITAFANQNVPTHTTGLGGADVVGTVGAGAAKGAKSIAGAGFTIDVTGFAKKGDIFTIAGHTQQYVVTDTSLDTTHAGAITAIAFEPGLQAAVSGGEVLTFSLPNGTATTKAQSLLFHRNAFALAMAPLSTLGDGLGARIETIADPLTNIALRSRLYYVGDESALKVAIDCLFGYTVLDRNRAVRMAAN